MRLRVSTGVGWDCEQWRRSFLVQVGDAPLASSLNCSNASRSANTAKDRPVLKHGCAASSAQDLSGLLLYLYSMEGDLPSWKIFLEKLAKLVRADGASFASHDLRTKSATGISVPNEAIEVERYVQHFSAINPWILKDGRLSEAGSIISGESVIPLTKLRRTEFYNDWGRRNNVVFSIAVHIGAHGGLFRYVALNRGEQSGTYSDDVFEVLALVVPHLQNALRLQERLTLLGDLGRVLDHMTLPVFLLDTDCHVREMTKQAELHATSDAGLNLSPKNRLSLTSAPKRLSDELNALASSDLTPFRLFEIPDPQEYKTSVGLLIRQSTRIILADSTFLLVVLTPTPDISSTFSEISRLYGLTPAEGRFVRTLITAGSLDLAIEVLGISRNTARTQMASIFRKTGTRRQGQVIQLFSFVGRITHLADA